MNNKHQQHGYIHEEQMRKTTTELDGRKRIQRLRRAMKNRKKKIIIILVAREVCCVYLYT